MATYLFDNISGSTNEAKMETIRTTLGNGNHIIEFNSGQTYTFTQMVSLQGVNGLTFRSTGSTKAILTTSLNNLFSRADGTNHSVDNLTFDNLKIQSTGNSTANESSSSLIFFGYGSGSNITVQNCEFTAPNAYTNAFKIYVVNGGEYQNINFINNYVHDMGRMGIETINHHTPLAENRIHDIVVSGNNFSDLGLINYGMAMSFSGRNTDVLAEDNDIHNVRNCGVEMIGGLRNIVRNNRFTGSGDPIHTVRLGPIDGRTIPNTDVLAENNVSTMAGANSFIQVDGFVSRNNSWYGSRNMYFQSVNNILFENDDVNLFGENPYYQGGTPTAFLQMATPQNITDGVTSNGTITFKNCNLTLRNDVGMFQINQGTVSVEKSNVYLPSNASRYNANGTSSDVRIHVNGTFHSEIGDTGTSHGTVGYTDSNNTTPMATRYVNTTGGGDGSSTSSTWTITQAFNNAVAGDVVYIQAGSYGNVNLVQSNNGTSTNRIQFIGCDSSWNPVDSSTPSFWNKDVFDDRIPFLDGGLQDGQRASNGKGFIVNGNFVTLNNICFKGFEQGGDWNGDDGIAYNLSTDYMGTMVEDNSTSQDWDPVTGDYLGRSISVSGARFEHRNSLHRDADAQGVTASGSYGVYDNIMIYTSNQASGVTNSTDYQFLFDQGSNNNTVTNLYITREAGTLHLSHGIVFKPQSGECHSNVVDGFYLINSKVEIQYGGARNNIVRNGEIWNTTGRSGDASNADYGATAITLANGAHDNLLENIFLYQPTFGIWNNNWYEGEPNQGLNNTLVNIVIVEPRQGHLAFQGNGAAQNLNMYNCTFVGGDRLVYTNNSGSGATGGLYNSIIHGVGSFTNSTSPLSSSFVFDTVNLTNSFTNSTLSSYTDSNISNIAFSFVDEATSVFDTFNYNITSTALESGKSFTGIESQQGFDFNETTRTSPFTIGAYEYNGETNPDPEPEPSNKRRVVLLRFIYN